MADDYLRWVHKNILAMRTYAASPRGFAVKLDAMESPWSMPPPLYNEWKAALSECAVNRYPESESSALKDKIARHIGMPAGCGLLFGNGSDELIQLLAWALADAEHTLVTPEPGFAIYRMAAMSARMPYHAVSLDADFDLDKDSVLEVFKRRSCALLCLAQPNNPTGNLWDKRALSEIIGAAPGYVLLDEAYEPYVSASDSLHSMDLLRQHPNLLVLRTFSKIGFAGLRFGFLVGSNDIVSQLNKIRLPYNIGSLVQKTIELALRHYALIEEQIDQVRALRDKLLMDMNALGGVTVFPTQTNFILFRVPPGTSDAVFNDLKKMGILIKSFADNSPQNLRDCLRVTVGTGDENALFVNALKKILAN